MQVWRAEHPVFRRTTMSIAGTKATIMTMAIVTTMTTTAMVNKTEPAQ